MKSFIWLLITILTVSANAHPTDASIIERFNASRSDLEQLIEMMETDQLETVYTVPRLGCWPDKLSSTRLDEYGLLLKKIGITGCGGSLMFITFSEEHKSHREWSSKGLVFTRNTIEPIVEDLDKETVFDLGFPIYRKLDKHWYLYRLNNESIFIE